MSRSPVSPHIAKLDLYAPPWTGLDRRGYLRLDLNECTCPLPRVAVEAITEELPFVPLYPDYQVFRGKLAEYCGLPPGYLLVTNGSDQGIDVVLRAFITPGEAVAFARPEFPMFGQIAGLLDARIIGVPYRRDLSFPYEEFRKVVAPPTRVAVVINPNNPTGTPVERDYIESLVREFSATPILVDEAYFEYTNCTVIDLVPKYPNLIVLRTFSKAFAMAGLRLGYIAAQPELIGHFQKIRGPFDVNSLAIAAASAQIDHPEESLARVAEITGRSKPLVERFFRSYGVKFHPGAASFLLVESPRRDEIVEYMKVNRILVRPMYAEPLRCMFRMSLGTADEMRQFVEVFRLFEEESKHDRGTREKGGVGDKGKPPRRCGD
jgi:histidinol-phosphate aminotransferase